MLLSKHASSPSPGTFGTVQEELTYYKAQYEHLANELQEFQETSRELEAELEKDAEAAEKREHALKTTIESLRFEVEEWKNKHRQCKTEANSAQNNLQKEITSLRDANRSIQLKLRDVEVANDDFERQARNTTSTLEDIESKYDATLERNILLEEEIQMGEQEREQLRIETQRLREELRDLRIEAEIARDKLRMAESNVSKTAITIPHEGEMKGQSLFSPPSEHSLRSASSSIGTTPLASRSDSSAPECRGDLPSSPFTADASAKAGITSLSLARAEAVTSNHAPEEILEHSNGSAVPFASGIRTTRKPVVRNTPVFDCRPPSKSTKLSGEVRDGLQRSGSLYQIRGLMGKMQKLEERVQSVRSKLPAVAVSPSSSRGEDGEISATATGVTGRPAGSRRSNVVPTSRMQEQNPARRRESHRPSRSSLTGQIHAESSNMRNGIGQSAHVPPSQNSISRDPNSSLVSTLNRLPPRSSMARPASSLARRISSGDRDQTDASAIRKESVHSTSPKHTPDDNAAVDQRARKSTGPLRAQVSERNLRASVSGATLARPSRHKRSMNHNVEPP